MVTVETPKNENSKGKYSEQLDNLELHVKWWVWAARFWDKHAAFIPEAGDTEKSIFNLNQMNFYYTLSGFV